MSQTTQLRRAERVLVPDPIPAVLAEENARIVELSLVGAGIEHTARAAINAVVPLDFIWRGERVVLRATIARSELRVVNGKNVYFSGVSFCGAIFDSPPTIRRIMRSIVDQTISADAFAPRKSERVAFFKDEDEDVSSTAPYLECILEDGGWRKRRVWTPNQPREGFTMIAPENPAAIDPICKNYENATADARRMFRASAELSIAQNRKS